MNTPAKYFIVEADAMPEIFRKVAEAKRLLETGEETTVNGATRAVGISRSAFYKYKDSVRPFNDMLHGRILTINQNIPANGCAVVTMTAETSTLRRSLEEVLGDAKASPGVLKCEILAG